jgi:hypothetical protein
MFKQRNDAALNEFIDAAAGAFTDLFCEQLAMTEVEIADVLFQ